MKARLPVFLLLLGLFAGLTAVFQTVAGLHTSAAAKGIVSLEVAGTVDRARAILHSWHVAGWDRRAGFNLGVDFLYIPTYAALTAMAYGWVADLLHRRHAGRSRIWAVGVTIIGLLAWLQLPAGLSDMTENVFLFRVLEGPLRSSDVTGAAWAAWLKFGILGLGGAAALFGLAVDGVQRVARTLLRSGGSGGDPPSFGVSG